MSDAKYIKNPNNKATYNYTEPLPLQGPNNGLNDNRTTRRVTFKNTRNVRPIARAKGSKPLGNRAKTRRRRELGPNPEISEERSKANANQYSLIGNAFAKSNGHTIYGVKDYIARHPTYPDQAKRNLLATMERKYPWYRYTNLNSSV